MEMYQFLPPYTKVLVKIHTPENRVRPIVNGNNTTAYKLAEFIKHTLNLILMIPFSKPKFRHFSIAPNKRLIPLHNVYGM